MRVDAYRRNPPLEMVDANRVEDQLYDHVMTIETKKNIPALRTGLVGAHYTSYLDED